MRQIRHIACESLLKCKVPRLYNLMGRRWVFPIFCRISDDGLYRFEDLILMSRKNIHRSTLSSMLKELVSLDIMQKQGKLYRLTRKGRSVKRYMIYIGNELLSPKKCQEINN